MQPAIVPPIHLAHAARADRSGYFIRPEACARDEGHGILRRLYGRDGNPGQYSRATAQGCSCP
jgi:hypothetical protein